MAKGLTRPCRIVSEHLSSHGGRTLVTAGVTNVAWLSPIVRGVSRTLFGLRNRGCWPRHTLARLREGIFSSKAITWTINTGVLLASCESQHTRHEHKCQHTRAPCRIFFQDTQAGKTSFCDRFWFSRDEGPRWTQLPTAATIYFDSEDRERVWSSSLTRP